MLAGRPDPLIYGLGAAVLRRGLPRESADPAAGAFVPTRIDEHFGNADAA